MMIGVISDTHGRVDAWKKAEAVFEGADLIVHAGDVLYHPPRLGWSEGYDIPAMVEALNASDIPIVIAQGNCDSQVYEELLEMPVQAPYALAEMNGIRIVVSHGHLYTKESMIELAKRYKARIFVSGHTHIPVLEEIDGVILLNPGSPSIPKYEVNGKLTPSVAIITDDNIKIISLDDQSTLFSLDL